MPPDFGPAPCLGGVRGVCARALSGLVLGLLAASCGGKAESLPSPGAEPGGRAPPSASQGGGQTPPGPAFTCADNPLASPCVDGASPPRPESSPAPTPTPAPSVAPDVSPEPIPELADPNATPLERASAVLDTRCGSCHGRSCGPACDGTFEIGDLALMIQTGKIEACRWTDSRLYRRVLDRTMPPEYSRLLPPSTEEFEVVGEFVNGICGSLVNSGPEDTERVAVENLLRDDCSACHGQQPADAGAAVPPHFDGVTDIAELISSGLIQPCDSAASLLVQRLQDGSMPPPDSTGPRPTAAEIDAVAAFIDRPCKAR